MPRKKKDQKTKLGQELIQSLEETSQKQQILNDQKEVNCVYVDPDHLPKLDLNNNSNNSMNIIEGDTMPEPLVLPVYTNKALSTCRIGNDWFLVEIEYNPETKEVGPIKMEPVGTFSGAAMERFKIEAITRKVIVF